jgi:hypothetical protein
MTSPKVQHYVSQFLLRNFGSCANNQIFVFDKRRDRNFRTNSRNIASESRFYDFEWDGGTLSLEPWLSKLEAQAAPVIAEILRADSLAALSPSDRKTLCNFLAVQLTRSRAFREQWMELPTVLRDHIISHGDTVASGSQAEDFLRPLTENEAKGETASFILQSVSELAPHFVDKIWVLAATTPEDPFFTSDNPLTRQNLINNGNLGLAVPGIEIYLPFSPVRALTMWCPSLVSPIREAVAARASSGTGLRAGLELIRAVDSGKPLQYDHQNVRNFNSLQVAQSERYIFSCGADFGLAREMIRTYLKITHLM